MRRVNVFAAELEHEPAPPGFASRGASVGERRGGELIGAGLFELAAGEQSFPYHYHHGVEEWLYVVAGKPTLRTPAGERALRAGELICFGEGPSSAHSLLGPGRVLILSDKRAPSICVYPDSDKLGTRPASRADPDRLNFRRTDAVDYWYGE